MALSGYECIVSFFRLLRDHSEASKEEGLVAQAHENPPLRNLHAHFDYRFIPRVGRSRRQDDSVVVRGPHSYVRCQDRQVATRVADAAFS